ncbi:CLUMA_CG020003, isoform A [Clunio marinus]|uniref:U3 small nucleolar RNA-associated protein 25 homolog n=1 Tax=Clunio marinus TaxID=568069 RepID=A0A1J1J5E8_9DIPT|nr:CLUMA_CG020003, isoform A [Clunio marinus]
MGKGGKFQRSKKSNFMKNKKNYHKKSAHKKPNRYMMVKKQIQANKESEDLLKRQQLAEIKYNQKKEIEVDHSSDSEPEDQAENNDFQELLFTLRSNKRTNEVESSESSSDDEEEEAEVEKSDNEDELEESSDENDSEHGSEIGTENEASVEEMNVDQTINTEFLDDSIAHDLIRDNESDSEGSDSEEENEERKDSKTNNHSNPFTTHLKHDLSTKLFEAVSSTPPKKETIKLTWPTLDSLIVEIPRGNDEPPTKRKQKFLGDEEVFASEGQVPKLYNSRNIKEEISIKKQIIENICEANKSETLTSLQTEIVSVASNYQDIYYPHRTHQNGEQLRLSYCIHTLDHILKTRQKVLQHNSKISKLKASRKNVIIPDEFRDQGFVRPRVLIVLPFRDSAFKVVNMLIDLLNPEGKSATVNYKRFVDEFTGDSLHFPKKNPKPEDYEQTFSGNTEDTFRVGLSLTKKSMKLYTPFYSSDILIASPLGLRLIIGAPGEKDREYDFLASIELLVLDQMELFLAQNWDHLLYVFDHLHLQPQSRQNTDFSRVRSWCLNGWSKFYRQTLLFSSYDLPEFRSLFNNRCHNYQGKVRTANVVKNGSIRHVIMEIPQIFHRIEVKSLESSFDTRFEYFSNTILPQFKAATMAHCMIYVPSYFDYVRIRNYMKKEEINFTQICEYTKDNKISRARTLFYHGGSHFLLYSERAHFFRRMRIKGIRHIIMYQPPMWNNFYPEIINLMQEINQNPRDDVVNNSMSITVLYTKYDILQLSAIVGHDNVAKMLASKKQTNMFMNNE